MKTSLIAYFEETVKRNPNRVSVWSSGKNHTFMELAMRAQLMAHLIHKLKPLTGKIVGVFLPKCFGVNVANFGVLMSGNGFMNLDVKTPVERISGVLQTVEPLAIVTDEKGRNVLKEVWTGSFLMIEEVLAPAIEDLEYAEHWDFFGHRMIDSDPFCIINTSGSTGTPKSVVTPWRCFQNFVLWSIELANFKTDEEVSASISPIFFDAWVQDILLMATIGLTQVQIPDSYRMFPIKVLQLMKEQGVTYILWVPTFMTIIANSGLVERFPVPTLRTCWYAGEVLPPHQINIWMRAHPHATFVNLYGPMEVSEVCTYYVLPGIMDESKTIPIGKAIDNYDVQLITGDGKIVTEPHVEGEICARGNIAYGYYGLKDKTDSVFRQAPYHDKYEDKFYHTGDYGMYDENGDILFCGRKDSLIKHSGYRIELSEIEHVITNTLNLVTNGCVVYNKKKKEIVLFYENVTEITAADFRKAIGTNLPSYMVPTDCRRVTALPRGGTGKIDRGAMMRLVNEQ